TNCGLTTTAGGARGLGPFVRSPPGPLDSLPGRPGPAVVGVLPRAPADVRHAAVLAPGGRALLPRRGPGEPASARVPGGVAASPACRRRLAVRRPARPAARLRRRTRRGRTRPRAGA